MDPRPARRGRWLLPVVFVLCLAVLGVVGWQLAHRFRPQWFDREGVNAAELAALQSAPLAAAPAADADAGWPQWRGPHRDGRAPAGPLRTDWDVNPPKVLWSSPCGGGYASLAVVGGKVYTLDRQGESERVLCLDAATGKQEWAHETPADYQGMQYGHGPRATPTVHDGRLYAVGATGIFLALQLPRDPGGKPTLLWQKSLPTEFRAAAPTWGFASSPLVEGDLVIVQPGGKDGSVVAFDRVGGERRWAAGSDPTGYSSPVAATCAGVRQVIAVTGNSVLGIRPDDGRVLWRHPWETQFNGNIAAPVVVGDYVFVSSNYGKGCALLHLLPAGDGVRAEQVYFRKGRVMQNHHSTCVYRDGYLYGYDGDTLRCVDLRSGEVNDAWDAREVSGNRGKGCLILAGEQLLGQTQTGTLFLADADPTEFRLRGKVEGVLSGSECWALPVLLDGRIYTRDGEKVVCLDARPAPGSR